MAWVFKEENLKIRSLVSAMEYTNKYDITEVNCRECVKECSHFWDVLILQFYDMQYNRHFIQPQAA